MMNTKSKFITSFRDVEFRYNRNEDFWAGVRDVNGWEPETFDVLDKFIKPGMNFLDIGAWNGVCSIYAGLLGAKCFSVEPDDKAFIELSENARLNNVDMQLWNLAISDHSGTDVLRNVQDGFGNSMSSLLRRYDKEDKNIVVCKTLLEFMGLDMICKPDFIKMDVEGGESIIIPGSRGALKLSNCPLYLSLHPMWFRDREGDMFAIYDVLEDVYWMKEYTVEKFVALEQCQILLLPK